MPGTTTRRSYPFGVLGDNLVDLLSEAALAQAVDDDLFATATGAFAAHCCLVYRSSGDGTFPVPNTTDTGIGFPSESIDTDAYHNPVTNISRITVPTGLAGYYLFGANAHWAADVGGTLRKVYIDVNGDGNGWAEGQAVVASGTFPGAIGPSHSIVGMKYLADGDYIRLVAYQNSGGSVAMGLAGNTPNLWAVRLPLFS